MGACIGKSLPRRTTLPLEVPVSTQREQLGVEALSRCQSERGASVSRARTQASWCGRWPTLATQNRATHPTRQRGEHLRRGCPWDAVDASEDERQIDNRSQPTHRRKHLKPYIGDTPIADVTAPVVPLGTFPAGPSARAVPKRRSVFATAIGLDQSANRAGA